jgi:cellulose synthase/poly-beta-1,6-N-acetylglucosamine synthase-like glycosyltransferase
MPHEVMIALGWIGEPDYVAALSAELGVDWLGQSAYAGKTPQENAPARDRRPGEIILGAYGWHPSALREALARLPHGQHAILATRSEVDAIQLQSAEAAIIDHAIEGLWRADPSASARWGAEAWQILSTVAVIGIVLGGVAVAPDVIVPFVLALLTLPFLCIVLLRTAAVAEMLIRPATDTTMAHRVIPDAELPRYSAMIALYKEAAVLPDLVEAMGKLDYPSAKLDVLLVLEASDTETLAALAPLDLPGNIRPVIVPQKGPQTKPKALNYALELVASPFVVVYDAEDIPEPDQLRRALAAFDAHGPDVVCVQAQLGIHNTRQGWLPRQFALEYAALFDGLLPALERLGLPIPLGGTSNHFRVDLLKHAGGWDPYNVTEDADLGFRLARAGYRTLTIPSTTWEEAPIDLGSWIKQRTRWLKGWMQTYIVHTRRSARARRPLDWRGRIGLHGLIGGMLLSVLIHPICLAILAWQMTHEGLLAPGAGTTERVMVAIALFNLALGYASSMLAGAIAAWRRSWRWLSFQALLMPVYWLLISIAGYRALLQLFFAPHKWEKTSHGHSRPSAQNTVAKH